MANSSGASPQPAKKSCLGCFGWGIVISLVIFLGLVSVVGALALLGIQDINQSPLEISELLPFPRPPEYSLSPEQQNLRNQLGAPDHFTILFFEDDFGGTSTRMETWIYSSLGKSISWLNGSLESEETFPALSGEALPLPYLPEQFTAYMSLEEVIGAAGIDHFMAVPLEKELVPGGESFFADRLSFGLKNGQLAYVEAVGFSQETEAGAVEPSPEVQDPAPTPSEPAADWPDDIPLVFASDREAPNYSECHPQGSCMLQVFYQPALVGSKAANLTGPLGFSGAQDPVLSPNGSKVAFTGFREGAAGNHVFTVNIDGSGLQQISVEGFTHGHPSWSPDGSRLVYMSRPDTGTYYNLFISDLETGDQIQLTSGEVMDRYPDWAPDGNSIVFHSNREDPDPGECWPNCQWGLFQVDLNNREVSPLLYNGKLMDGAGAAWSPDGSQLAFHSDLEGNYDIFVLNLEQQKLNHLTNNPGEDIFPSWSPDGQFIAYETFVSDNFEIAVLSLQENKTMIYGSGSLDAMPDW